MVLPHTFDVLLDEIRANLMRKVAEETKQFRSFDRLREFIKLSKEAWHEYRIARKSHSFNPFVTL